ncbi:MAG: hypothetical protein M1825_002564 [Sarcosagium campestre]|nr:MAG: hypothetical protein M1825_002564 [Sarcosagium campestre]
MFTPRQLQLGTQKLKQKNPSVSSQTLRSSASFNPNEASPPEKLRVEGKAKNAPPPALSLFYKYELVSGLELIFSDYSHLDERSAQWLRSREQVENEEGGSAPKQATDTSSAKKHTLLFDQLGFTNNLRGTARVFPCRIES